MLVSAANDITVNMLFSNFHHGFRTGSTIVGGNLQIKGWYYYNKIPVLRHRGRKTGAAHFFIFFSHQACRKRLTKKSYWVVLCHIVWFGRCQPLEVRNTEIVFCAKQTPIICFIYQFKNTKSISHIKLSNCLGM